MDYTIPNNFNALSPAQRKAVLAKMTVAQRVLLYNRAAAAIRQANGMAGLFDWIGDVFNTVKDVVVKAAPVVGGVVSLFNPITGAAIASAGKLVGGGSLPWNNLPAANNQQGPPQNASSGSKSSLAPLLIGGAVLWALSS